MRTRDLPRSREVLVLQELRLFVQGVATIASIPIGTVMSTLARARERLQQVLGRSTGRAAAGTPVRRDGGAL
jgi:DNA-directed RNA polymerase specialized sigma24 family protein